MITQEKFVVHCIISFITSIFLRNHQKLHSYYNMYKSVRSGQQSEPFGTISRLLLSHHLERLVACFYRIIWNDPSLATIACYLILRTRIGDVLLNFFRHIRVRRIKLHAIKATD